MRRVRGETRAGTKEVAAAGDSQEVEGELVARIDPVRLLVQTAVGVSYVIAVVTSFDVLRGGRVEKNVDSVKVSELQQPSTTVRCQVLRPQVVGDDESATLRYSSESFCENITVPGCYARPVNPEVCTVEEDGSCQWQLPVYSLTVLMELHHLELGAEERKKVPPLSRMAGRSCATPPAQQSSWSTAPRQRHLRVSAANQRSQPRWRCSARSAASGSSQIACGSTWARTSCARTAGRSTRA